MTHYSKLPAILVLEDGTVFHGKAAGKIGTTTGEICFNTGATGYQEIFTDPSYYGQIMIATNAHIGNYGVRDAESESDQIQIAGLVCKNYNIDFSRMMADSSLQTFFEDGNLVGISEVDTRALVRHVRNKGAMNAIISSENQDVDVLKKQLAEIPPMKGRELSSEVSTKQPYFYGDKDAKYKVAVLDLGVKRNILRSFSDRDTYIQVFPAKTSFKEMQAWNPDGYVISNGPGDPAAMDYAVGVVKEIITSKKPMFGICLGHQLLALANGIRTEKMFNGHRGSNHPVKNLVSERSEITSQNHGFGIVSDDAHTCETVEVTHINLNDASVEGIRMKDRPVFSVQYHPEASPGPHDSRYLFDEFIALFGQ